MTATLVLVHGAWHRPSTWDRMIAELPGIDVRTVDLPSSGDDPQSVGDLHDDAAELARLLAGIDGPSVVVAHSYGGVVATQGITADSGVAHLVYVCAFQLDVGESLLGLVGGQPPPWWEMHDRHIVPLTPEAVFYNGVSPDLTARMVSGLRLQSRATFEQASRRQRGARCRPPTSCATPTRPSRGRPRRCWRSAPARSSTWTQGTRRAVAAG